MKDKIIIAIIAFIDPKNKLILNPIHLIFFLILTMPVISIKWQTHPTTMRILAFIVGVQILLFFLKLLVKDTYKDEIDEVKNSIPDFNLLHLIMFALIASPVLAIVCAVLATVF